MNHRPLSSLLLLLALAVTSASAASAQSLNKQAIRQQLEHKAVLLRGRYVCPTPNPCTLVFNRQGQLQRQAKVAPFSLSAIYVDSLKFGETTLTIQAHEATILRLSNARPYQLKTLTLNDQQLVIQVPFKPSQPSELQTSLHAIFASDIQKTLNAELPDQRDADLATLPLLTKEGNAKAKHELEQVLWPKLRPLQRILKKGLTRPRPIYSPQPRYTNLARHDHVQGICRVELLINTQGLTQNIRILRSLPDGLDKQAIATISEYRFQPSRTVNGKPVPVAMIVDIDFHLH